MSEPTLSLTYSDLQAEVGFFLGYGRGSAAGDTAWTAHQQRDIDACLKSGLRNFYVPPPLAPNQASYEWSFLRPTTTVTLLSGERTVPLPPDFGGIDGRITLSGGTGRVYSQVPITNVGAIDEQYGYTSSRTGFPLMAAIRPVRPAGESGQRHELYVFPDADGDYVLRFTYIVEPNYLTTAMPYHFGGMIHAETVLQACLAAAEEKLDDARTVHAAKFQERLAASIHADRKLKGQELGYNGDRSDWAGTPMDRRVWQGSRVSFYGITPG